MRPFERMWLYAVGLLARYATCGAAPAANCSLALALTGACAPACACCSQSQCVSLSLSLRACPPLVNSITLYVMLRTIGSMFGTAAKLKKARNLRKFSDQGWQLAVHASFAVRKKKIC